MKKFTLGLCLALGPLAHHHAGAHVEIAGRIVFENHGNELYVKAILDKRLLTLALMYEGDCTPKEMLSVCGEKYLQSNIKLTVNCVEAAYEKLSYEVQQHEVVFSYKIIRNSEPIRSIGVNSTYLLKYNDHGIVRAQFAIDEASRSFDLTADRQAIEVNFNQI